MMLPKKRMSTHPSEMLLKEFLVPMALTQKAFCEHVGWTYARLNEIVNGKRGISADSALTLADAFNMELEFWLNLQRNWDLWHAAQTHDKVPPIKNAA
jgi:antitoxin HigA-1